VTRFGAIVTVVLNISIHTVPKDSDNHQNHREAAGIISIHTVPKDSDRVKWYGEDEKTAISIHTVPKDSDFFVF